MVQKIKAILSKKQFYIAGLVLFFVLHRWNELFVFLSFLTILKITGSLLLLAAVLFKLVQWVTGNVLKAALFSFASLFFCLFYSLSEAGADLLSVAGWHLSPRFLLFLLIVLTGGLLYFIPIKKLKLHLFLNTVCIVLVLFETGQIIMKTSNQTIEAPVGFIQEPIKEPLPHQPSVYLILLDEYAGAESLTKYYGYNNQSFLDSLKNFGFKIVNNASSNYNYTLLSMASMFNGEYLYFEDHQSVYSNDHYTTVLKRIYQNKTFNTFRSLGYRTLNYSPFEIAGTNTAYSNSYLPSSTMLLLHPTIFDDLLELLPFYIARKINANQWLEKMFRNKIAINYQMMDQVLKETAVRSQQPVFCYLHLMMPHAPFAVDSTGKINLAFLSAPTMTTATKQKAYLEYLVHVNHVVVEFIRNLKANTKGEAVILLMSDHGSRDLMSAEDPGAGFNALNASYFPNQGGTAVYPANSSNVNQFPLLFSTLSKQSIPVLKDLQIRE